MKSVKEAQEFALIKCLDNGELTLQKRKFSKFNEAVRLAVRAGLMKHKTKQTVILTDGGKQKAIKLKGE